MLQLKYFEIVPKELNKLIGKVERYGRMIDPKDLVEGSYCLKDVQCQGCQKISIMINDIRECIKCKKIICHKCYQIACFKIDEAMVDQIQENLEEDGDISSLL